MSFVPFDLEDGVRHAVDGFAAIGWSGRLDCDGTVFGLVLETSAVTLGEDTFRLRSGSFFVSPEPVKVEGGRGLAIHIAGYRGLRQLGGPIEDRGRLRYIDGCTDTLLVCPPRLGEPCLNHLHIPAGTDQSAHTHPSVRIGVIVRGTGICRTEAGDFPLHPGLGWIIPAGLRHAFATSSESLDVLAWHPDSDFGPTDGDHPMINRTMLP